MVCLRFRGVCLDGLLGYVVGFWRLLVFVCGVSRDFVLGYVPGGLCTLGSWVGGGLI